MGQNFSFQSINGTWYCRRPLMASTSLHSTIFCIVVYVHKHTTDFLSACVQDPEGKPKKANIRDNRDGTYTVSYVPDMTGRYTITIKYGGDEIPYSPYRIHALPTGDASKCLVTGQTPTITPLATNQIPSPETVTASLIVFLFSYSVNRRTRTG